ncbi:hypothetical protein GC194_01115 [bacterium]|nr:hypothetical protein [bacterium]
MRYQGLLLLPVLLFFSFQVKTVDWFQILGKTFEDRDVQNAFAPFGDSEDSDYRLDYLTQINWEDDGISAVLTDQGKIVYLMFYNEQYTIEDKVFKRYNGQLPLGVGLDMSPKKVISKLGEPTVQEGSVVKRVLYVTNYTYEFVFKADVMQYMKIGLIPPNMEKAD